MRRALIILASFVVAGAGIYLLDRRTDMASASALQCALAAVFLAVLGWQTSGWLRNALIVVCSLVAGLAIAEAAVLALRPAPGPAGAVVTDTGKSGGRPYVGWGALSPGAYRASKVEPDGRVVYDTVVTIDENLNRKTTPSTAGRAIAIFGDSWMFGAGLNDDGTVAQALADLEHGAIPVLNLGYPGWSPAVNLIALQKGLYKKLLAHPRHFILFASMFHVERTSCRTGYRFSGAPRFVRVGNGLAYAGQCSEIGGPFLEPMYNFVRRFALYERIAPYFAQPTKADVETFMEIVKAFVAQAKRDYDVETTVLVPPKGDVYIARSGYTEAQVVERLRQAGVDVLMDDLPQIDNPRLYWIEGDGHPSALSNRARARAIKAHIEKVDPAALQTAAAP